MAYNESMKEIEGAMVMLIDAFHKEGFELLEVKLDQQLCFEGKEIKTMYGVKIKQ